MSRHAWWLPPVFLACMNFWLSTWSWQQARERVPWLRRIPQRQSFKTRHVVQYGPLAIATAIAAETSLGFALLPAAVSGIAVATGVGAASELVQAFIPSRIPAAIDIVFDLVGGAIGVVAYLFARALYMVIRRLRR